MAIAVVIPAHNEESVVERCLDALLTGARPGELDIVVVCNGCEDRTAEKAQSRAHGEDVRVLETGQASKTEALNLGDRTVSGFPRFYVDADVVLDLDGLRRIAARLVSGDGLAASPSMDMDLGRSTWPVRAYYRVWTSLPYVREGMIGVGVYALSEAGRRRFEEFPDVIADDGFVRMLFTADERLRVDGARVRVMAPRRMDDLLRIKTRSRLGGYELMTRFPELAIRERRSKSYGGAMRLIVLRPWLWPHAIVYAAVQLTTRRRARSHLADRTSYVWEKDLSTRRAEER
jgi:glycosyltransferase involved in cell wall biosynthesis